MYKVVGIFERSFKKDDETIKFSELHLIREVGQGSENYETLVVRAGGSKIPELSFGDTVNVYYNRFGKVEKVEKID